jgi:hypothetical protein
MASLTGLSVQNRIDENAINAVALCKSGLTSFTLN